VFCSTNFVPPPHFFFLVIFLCKLVELAVFLFHLHEAYISCIIYISYSLRSGSALMSLCSLLFYLPVPILYEALQIPLSVLSVNALIQSVFSAFSHLWAPDRGSGFHMGNQLVWPVGSGTGQGMCMIYYFVQYLLCWLKSKVVFVFRLACRLTSLYEFLLAACILFVSLLICYLVFI
jgi:hypothetical protein